MKHTVAAAGEIASRLVEARDGDEPALAWLVEAVREFSLVEFDVPDDADADGWLFQYGPVGWLPEPTFVVSVVRQLEVVDAGGEHESYVQVQFEVRYDVDDDLAAVGPHSQWWFPGGGTSWDDWLDDVSRAAVWATLESMTPRDRVVVEDAV